MTEEVLWSKKMDLEGLSFLGVDVGDLMGGMFGQGFGWKLDYTHTGCVRTKWPS